MLLHVNVNMVEKNYLEALENNFWNFEFIDHQ